MHIITVCPICNEDFMYHQTEANLIRNITFVDEVGNNEITQTVICQDCDLKEKTKNKKDMKYTISYWKHKDDEVVDVERDVEANSFDDAYREFRDSNPFVKIRSIYENSKR